jgi:soluble lytic murein transglycosylase-like protein
LGHYGAELKLHRSFQLAIALAALAAVDTPVYGAEHVTLSNGFAMDCNHHVQVEGRLRLYLSAGESSYIEMRPDEVMEIEEVPDTAPQAATAENGQPPVEEKLSPADLHEMLSEAGHEHNLDEDLLASVVKAESGGNTRAVSRAGARGLMQLMPSTASDLGVQDSFRPGENVRGGSTYLDALLTKYHENLALALAAYNAGPAAVDKYHGIPRYHETRVYVARVIHEFNQRVKSREAQAARPPSPRVTSRASSSE